MNNGAYIRIEKLTKRYDRITAVDNVSLLIQKGEIFGLMGSSGCGKSTLLQILAGLVAPTQGAFFIDGQDMTFTPPYLRPVNMMFQSYALFPHMSVMQNIAFGLQQDKLPKKDIQKRVDEMLDIVHMSDFRHEKPETLSGGQRQRVALARSLAKRPKLLLLDEPMGALDQQLRYQMQLEVANILDQVGATCLLVTHDQEEAMTMSSRIGIMDKGEILQIGTPKEVYEYPNSRFSARFLGAVNIFEGHVLSDGQEKTLIKTKDFNIPIQLGRSLSLPKGLLVALAVRPEKIDLSLKPVMDAQPVAQGKVHDIAYMGSHSIYHIVLHSGNKMEANIYHSDRFLSDTVTWGDEVFVYFQPECAVVLRG